MTPITLCLSIVISSHDVSDGLLTCKSNMVIVDSPYERGIRGIDEKMAKIKVLQWILSLILGRKDVRSHFLKPHVKTRGCITATGKVVVPLSEASWVRAPVWEAIEIFFSVFF